MQEEHLSPENIEKAFAALLKISKNAVEIVKRLDGKASYIDIAKELGMNATSVSSVQTESWKLKLSDKVGTIYKKRPGILKYSPRSNSHTKINNNSEKLERMKKIKFKEIKPSRDSKEISFRISEAVNMSFSYQWLYVTENALRDLIRKKLGGTDTWWRTKCPPDFMQKVSDMKSASLEKRKDELEYCELDHLKKIIARNWSDFKDAIVPEKDKFILQFENALPTRHSIGHCIPLEGLSKREVEVRFNDILKMIR